MSSYVDLMGDVRWTEQAHVDRVELELRSTVTHLREHVLDRRLISVFAKALSLLMPPAPPAGTADPYAAVRGLIVGIAAYFQPLTPAAMQELGAAAAAMAAIDTLASNARADSALLDSAIAYEGWRAQQAALPPVPVADPVTGIVPPDPLTTQQRADVEAQRSALQAQMNAATTETTSLVSQRDSYRITQGTPIPGQPLPVTP